MLIAYVDEIIFTSDSYKLTCMFVADMNVMFEMHMLG